MTYDGTTLQVTITDTVTMAHATQLYTVNIPAIVGGSTAYVGFTGSTGPLTAVQQIQGWAFTPAPTAPTNLQLVSANSAQVNISWTNNDPNATAVLIERKTGAGGTYAQIGATANGSINTFTDNSVVAGQTYYYRVRATNNASPSTYSNELAVATTTTPQTDLQITNTDGQVTAIPGSAVTYTIVVTNAGPSAVTGATVADAFPAVLSAITYTATATGGATGFTANGSGNINNTVNMPVGSTITYIVHATLSGTASGNLVNTATVSTPGNVVEINSSNNTATDTDSLSTPPPINFPNGFAGANQFTFNGAAAKLVGSNLQVTDGGTQEATSIFNTAPVNITRFSTTFTIQQLSGTTPTGDGMVFAIQGVGPTDVGFSGGNLGFGGMYNESVGIKFDLYDNAGEGPDSTGLYLWGPSPTSAGSIDLTGTGIDLHSGHNFQVTVSYDGTTLTVTITDATTLAQATQNYTVDIPSIVGGNTAYVGFTGGTGGATAVQNVLNWVYAPAPAAPSSLGVSSYTASQVNLNWTNNDPNATAVLVERKTGAGGTYAQIGVTANGSVNTFTDNTVSPGTTYYYRVRATNSGANSTYSNEVNVTTTTVPQTDLQVTMTDGQTTAVSGLQVTYTIVVTNAGTSTVTGASIVDALPSPITDIDFEATATLGATGFTADGYSNINDTVTMPAGSTITYILLATLSPSATGSLVNTASVSPPAGVTDTNPSNNSVTDTDTITPQADLQLTNTDNQTVAVPGNPMSYTVVVTNAGPGIVTGASVTDTLPASLTSVTYTATATGGATGFTANGSGNLNDTVNLPVGATITYVISGTLNPATTANLVNTATVTAPAGVTDTNTTNNSVTDTDTIAAQADLQITNTDGQTQANPGSALTYTIVVTNAGPSNVTGATVTDTFPAMLTGVTYTATATGGATGFTASGSGNINNTVNLPAGSHDHLRRVGHGQLVGHRQPGQHRHGNHARHRHGDQSGQQQRHRYRHDHAASRLASHDQRWSDDGRPRRADQLHHRGNQRRAKQRHRGHGRRRAAGHDPQSDLHRHDDRRRHRLHVVRERRHQRHCHDARRQHDHVHRFRHRQLVGQRQPGQLGQRVGAAGVTDGNLANNTATDTDTLGPVADLQVTVTDGQASAVPGTPITYTIVVTNAGPSNVSGATVADTFPAALSGINYTASATGGATGFTANGSGNVNDTVTLPAGSTITYIVSATLSAAATGTLANTATVTAPAGVTDSNAANNSATDSDTLTPQADLQATDHRRPDRGHAGTPITLYDRGHQRRPEQRQRRDRRRHAAGRAHRRHVHRHGHRRRHRVHGQRQRQHQQHRQHARRQHHHLRGDGHDQRGGHRHPGQHGHRFRAGRHHRPATGNNSATDTDTLTPQADLQITKTDGQTSAVPGQLDHATRSSSPTPDRATSPARRSPIRCPQSSPAPRTPPRPPAAPPASQPAAAATSTIRSTCPSAAPSLTSSRPRSVRPPPARWPTRPRYRYPRASPIRTRPTTAPPTPTRSRRRPICRSP